MYCIFQNQMILPNTLRVQLTNLENAPDFLQTLLNTINFTSITQKVNRTYKRVLEGAVVGVLWSFYSPKVCVFVV